MENYSKITKRIDNTEISITIFPNSEGDLEHELGFEALIQALQDTVAGLGYPQSLVEMYINPYRE